MPRYRIAALLTLLLTLALTACGTKGGLEYPPAPPQKKSLAAVTIAPTRVGADLSTPLPARQRTAESPT